MNTTLVDIATH